MADNSELKHGDAGQDAARFREVFPTLPHCIAVVTAVDDGEPVGLTIGSLLPVSVDPPIVGFLPFTSSRSFARVRRAGAFCVNVLTAHQENVSTAFAMSEDKFAGLSWRPAPVTGSPVLEGVAAWIDCRITAVHEHGDHFIVIGDATGFDGAAGAMPLVFHRGRYMDLETTKQTLA